MKRAVLVIWMLVLPHAACGASDGSCALWDVVDPTRANPASTDCGSADTDDEPALTQAHDCVSAAFSQGVPFRVVWRASGIDAGFADAYVSHDGVTVEKLARDWSSIGGDDSSREMTSAWRCALFRSIEDCSPFQLSKFLCFDCTIQEPADTCESGGRS